MKMPSGRDGLRNGIKMLTYCLREPAGMRQQNSTGARCCGDGRKKMMRCVEREEIPEADSMPRFTSVLGGRPALVYVSGFTLRKV